MKQTIYITASILFCGALTSCVLTSKNPVGRQEESVVDAELTGAWAPKADVDRAEYLFIKKEKDNIFRFSGDAGEYIGFITDIEGDRYLNLREVRDVDGKRETGEEYILAYYSIGQDGGLSIALLNEDIFREAIKAGRVKGDVIKGEWRDQVTLTDTTDNLAAFLRDNDIAALMSEPAVFRKVGALERILRIWLPGNWVYAAGLFILALVIFIVSVILKRRY